jgi:nitronate monooxygenase
MFLVDDISRQAGTMALVPQIVDAVNIPVIAAGGIGDGRGVAAALALGAAAAQIGTAFMLTPEAKTAPLHRAALKAARGIVNRFIHEVGAISADAPAFPPAAGAAQPLRVAAEAKGSSDFTPLWSGQAPTLAREMPAAELVTQLVEETARVLERMGTRL